MPIVQIDLLEGRTVEQKKEMAREVTDAISKNCDCPREAVILVIRESLREHIAKGGKLMSES